MEQLSNIVALMLAEAIFAYESSFEIKVSGCALVLVLPGSS